MPRAPTPPKADAPLPPPPPPPSAVKAAATPPAPKPPVVASTGPAGAFLVEFLMYNGAPFKDHWAYFVCSRAGLNKGVVIHATGDVMKGFEFEIKRSHDFAAISDFPMKRIPLQWVDARYFDEKAMMNNGSPKLDDMPVCGFEASAHKVKAPAKSLNETNDPVSTVSCARAHPI